MAEPWFTAGLSDSRDLPFTFHGQGRPHGEVDIWTKTTVKISEACRWLRKCHSRHRDRRYKGPEAGACLHGGGRSVGWLSVFAWELEELLQPEMGKIWFWVIQVWWDNQEMGFEQVNFEKSSRCSRWSSRQLEVQDCGQRPWRMWVCPALDALTAMSLGKITSRVNEVGKVFQELSPPTFRARDEELQRNWDETASR